MKSWFAMAAAIAAVFGGHGAAAQAPVAVVEAVKGKIADVEFMDYVAVGKVIKLGAADQIVLGYLKSCWRETITGGTVVVGAEQSLTHQGAIERTKVDCDGGRVQIADPRATDQAATVFRNVGPGGQASPSPAKPDGVRTLYGASPLVELGRPDTLVIERTDKAGERHTFAVKKAALVRGKFYDLAKAEKALTPGASYVATSGPRKIAFRVDANAKPGDTPIVGRLLRFE